MNCKATRMGLTLGAVALISACGGGDKTVVAPSPNGLPYATAGLRADEPTMTGTYAGIAFKAQSSDATNVGSGGTFTNNRSLTQGEITVTILDANTIQISTPHLGTKTLYRDASLSSATAAVFDDVAGDADGLIQGTFGLSGAGTSLTTVITGAVYENNFGTSRASDTYLVSGFETNPTEMTTLANNNTTATYTGDILVTGRETIGSSVSTTLNVVNGTGGVSLTADFGTGSLTGTLTGSVDSTFLGGGTIGLDVNGNISSNGFSSSLTQNGSTTATGITLSNAQMSGKFYGVNAQELGGTVTADMNGPALTEPSTASGFFVGNR